MRQMRHFCVLLGGPEIAYCCFPISMRIGASPTGRKLRRAHPTSVAARLGGCYTTEGCNIVRAERPPSPHALCGFLRPGLHRFALIFRSTKVHFPLPQQNCESVAFVAFHSRRIKSQVHTINELTFNMIGSESCDTLPILTGLSPSPSSLARFSGPE